VQDYCGIGHGSWTLRKMLRRRIAAQRCEAYTGSAARRFCGVIPASVGWRARVSPPRFSEVPS
jgi:hypothetical protein